MRSETIECPCKGNPSVDGMVCVLKVSLRSSSSLDDEDDDFESYGTMRSRAQVRAQREGVEYVSYDHFIVYLSFGRTRRPIQSVSCMIITLSEIVSFFVWISGRNPEKRLC